MEVTQCPSTQCVSAFPWNISQPRKGRESCQLLQHGAIARCNKPSLKGTRRLHSREPQIWGGQIYRSRAWNTGARGGDAGLVSVWEGG
jgi:hypothetical protein